jgi:hypothetical protein
VGGVASWEATELDVIRGTMQSVMSRLINGGANTIKELRFREFHKALTASGFKLVKAESFGPAGGYQLFYQSGRVFARFKTLGDKAGPRTGMTHVSFSLTDGKALLWENDIGKFTKYGRLAPKNLVPLEKFDPTITEVGKRHFWYVIDSEYTSAAGDAWANSTHFSAPRGFDLSGVDEVIKTIQK